MSVNHCEIHQLCNSYPTGCPTNKWSCEVYKEIRNFIQKLQLDMEADPT